MSEAETDGVPHHVSCAKQHRLRRLAEANSGDGEPTTALRHKIAVEIHNCCGHNRLKAHRLAYGWSVKTAVAEFHAMCHRHPDLGVWGLGERLWMEWESPSASGHLASAAYQDLLCRLFETGPVQLGFAKDYGPTVERPNEAHGNPVAPVLSPIARAADAQPNVETLVKAAARESFDHAAQAETTNVGAMALEQLDAEVRRIARSYVHDDPVPLTVDMLHVRDRVYAILRGRHRPSQQSHLFLLAGQTCGLLANSTLDLGFRDAAMELARAAWSYGVIIGHQGLCAWIRGLQAMIAYWSGSPENAVTLARDGQTYAPGPTAKARLSSIEALAHSALPAEEEAVRALRDADLAVQLDGRDSLHDEIGGEFGFGRAKASYMAAGVYVHLRRADDAVGCAARALQLYESGPITQYAYGNVALARTDLMIARLLQRQLEAADAAAVDLLRLPDRQRIDGIGQRLLLAERILGGRPYGNDEEAKQLRGRLRAFRTTAPQVSTGVLQ
jgi:hypothetical protein